MKGSTIFPTRRLGSVTMFVSLLQARVALPLSTSRNDAYVQQIVSISLYRTLDDVVRVIDPPFSPSTRLSRH